MLYPYRSQYINNSYFGILKYKERPTLGYLEVQGMCCMVKIRGCTNGVRLADLETAVWDAWHSPQNKFTTAQGRTLPKSSDVGVSKNHRPCSGSPYNKQRSMFGFILGALFMDIPIRVSIKRTRAMRLSKGFHSFDKLPRPPTGLSCSHQ